MAAIINADDGVISGASGLKLSSDTSGALNIQTNGVTAIAISASQAVSFPATTSLNFTSANITTLTSSSATITNLLATTLTVSSVGIFPAGSASSAAITTAGDTNTGIFFPAADTIAFTEGGVEAARFDSSGNFGLGVTPSAVSDSYKNIQNGTAVLMGKAGQADVYLNANATFNSGWKYIVNGFATRYSQNDVAGGAHTWFTAASGTAGNAISFTQAMTLGSNGNLAIGATNTTVAKLYVVGSGNANSIMTSTAAALTGSANAVWIGDDGTDALIGPGNSGSSLSLLSRSGGVYTKALTLDAGANLGIATTPNVAKVNIGSGSGNNAIALDSWTITKWVGNEIQWGGVNASNWTTATFYTGGTERARITSDGNFLVNTTTAGNFRLNVNGPSQTVCGFSSYTANGVFDANARPSTVITPAGGTLRFGYFDEGFGQYNPAIGFRAGPVLGVGQTNYSNAIWATTNGGIAFGTGTAGTTTERARVASNGTFCVNTTNASFFLNVNGSNSAHFGDAYDGANYGVVQISRPANQGSAFHLSFIRAGFQVAGMGFLNNSSTFAVQVGGNNGSSGVTLTDGATSWGSTSDERKKNILGNVDNAMAKMASWRSVYYRYKIDKDDAPQRIGLIAQDVQATVPEAISVGDDEAGTLQLRYSEVIPVLVKAVQELKSELDQLKGKL